MTRRRPTTTAQKQEQALWSGTRGATQGCYNCGGHGHLSRSCPEGLKCFACNGIGHISSECPNKACFECKGIGHISSDCPTKTSTERATPIPAHHDEDAEDHAITAARGRRHESRTASPGRDRSDSRDPYGRSDFRRRHDRSASPDRYDRSDARRRHDRSASPRRHDQIESSRQNDRFDSRGFLRGRFDFRLAHDRSTPQSRKPSSNYQATTLYLGQGVPQISITPWAEKCQIIRRFVEGEGLPNFDLNIMVSAFSIMLRGVGTGSDLVLCFADNGDNELMKDVVEQFDKKESVSVRDISFTDKTGAPYGFLYLRTVSSGFYQVEGISMVLPANDDTNPDSQRWHIQTTTTRGGFYNSKYLYEYFPDADGMVSKHSEISEDPIPENPIPEDAGEKAYRMYSRFQGTEQEILAHLKQKVMHESWTNPMSEWERKDLLALRLKYPPRG